MPIKRIPNFLSDNPHVLLRPLAGICHVRWYGYTTIANYFAICPETALCGEIEILILIFSLRVPSSYSYTASYIAMIIYFIGDVLHIVKYGSYLLTRYIFAHIMHWQKECKIVFLTMYFWMRNLTTYRNYLKQTLRPNLKWYHPKLIAFFVSFESILIHKFPIYGWLINRWLI